MLSVIYRFADALRRRGRGLSGAAAQGRLGEDLAHRYLRSRGCTVVARNYRPRGGGVELDLVVWQGVTLAFVEVKTRASEDFGTPDRAVDDEKQRHIVRAAREYCRRAGVEWGRVRFDIVSVVPGKPARVDWMRDAFR